MKPTINLASPWIDDQSQRSMTIFSHLKTGVAFLFVKDLLDLWYSGYSCLLGVLKTPRRQKDLIKKK